MIVKLKFFFFTLAIFLAIASLRLGLVAPKFYESQIGYVMADTPNYPAAALFYLIFVFGMSFFVIEPGMGENSINKTVLRGAMIGLVTHATYDLTNLAALQGWPVLLTVVDKWRGALRSVL